MENTKNTNTETKEFKAGDSVFIMNNNAIEEKKIRAKNIFERYDNKANKVETKTEYFVEGVEREVSIDEIHKTIDDLVKSIKPAK